MKSGTSFFLGFVLGAAVCFGVLYLISKRQSPADKINENITMFKEPGGVLEYKSDSWRSGSKTYPYTEFRVFEVLPNGCALAKGKEDVDLYMGITVLFLPLRNGSYYDEQIIKVPKGQCARQAGVFKYENNMGMSKTVPVVRFYPKK